MAILSQTPLRGNRLFRVLDFYVGVPLSVLLSVFLRRRRGPVAPQQPSRILVSKLAGLGDAILLVPALRALRKRFPRAEITMLGTPLTGSFLRSFPEYIDHSITVDVGSLLRPQRFVRLVRTIRASKYDIAVDFEQWSRILPILFAMAGVSFRLGFRTNHQYRHLLLSQTVHHNSSLHELENFVSLVRSIDAGSENEDLEALIDSRALADVRKDLAGGGWRQGQPIVVLHPGCGRHGFPREWSPQRFAELAVRLSADGGFFVLTGTASEVTVMREVEHRMPKPPFHFVIDELPRLGALLSLASLFVSGNNGVMHLAAALKVPQVALHGPTDPRRWGPRSPRAVVVQSRCTECPCLNLGFEYHRTDGYCMNQISVDDVHLACIRVMSPTV